MRLGSQIVVGIMTLALLTGAACKKRTPQIPAQSHPPTIGKPGPTLPPVANQPQPTPPTVSPAESQPAPANSAGNNSNRTRRTHAKKPATSANTSAPASPKPGTSSKTVVDSNAGDPNVNISAEVPQGAASQRRQQTENLLQAAEANLRKVNRSLTDGEVAMQRQVRNFITQSRLAMQDGDLERSYNLATKAQLLSQELVK